MAMIAAATAGVAVIAASRYDRSLANDRDQKRADAAISFEQGPAYTDGHPDWDGSFINGFNGIDVIEDYFSVAVPCMDNCDEERDAEDHAEDHAEDVKEDVEEDQGAEKTRCMVCYEEKVGRIRPCAKNSVCKNVVCDECYGTMCTMSRGRSRMSDGTHVPKCMFCREHTLYPGHTDDYEAERKRILSAGSTDDDYNVRRAEAILQYISRFI